MQISVVIITYNEESKIEGALKSVQKIADEIILVDSFSSDDTIKIASKYTPHTFCRKWTNYADQKNFANGKAVFPWILSLDADERLSPELAEEIARLKETEPECAAYSMPRQVWYLGKWIRFSGWYPDRKTRLFRKDLSRWEGEFVHESLLVDGRTEKLKGSLHHFTYRDIRDHLERINQFSTLGAKKLFARNKKCRWYHLVLYPISRFVKSYILKRGFLDGFPGLVISIFNGYAIFVRYAKLREIWKKGERIEPFSN